MFDLKWYVVLPAIALVLFGIAFLLAWRRRDWPTHEQIQTVGTSVFGLAGSWDMLYIVWNAARHGQLTVELTPGRMAWFFVGAIYGVVAFVKSYWKNVIEAKPQKKKRKAKGPKAKDENSSGSAAAA